MEMLVFHPLSFITIAILFLHVNCQVARHPHGWAGWSSWTRERECLSGTCVGNTTESAQTVSVTPCEPSDPDCGLWSPWAPEPCSDDQTCDQQRMKECNETCFDDIWSQWGSWSSCSHSCGGFKSRSRYCIKGDCTVNNPGCIGETSMIVDCDHATEGILIATYNQAEMFIPSTKETFSLPSIPGSPRVWHTLTGTVICGGVYPGTPKSCLELKQNGDGWMPYSTALNEYRMAHSTWDSPSGIYLLGGYYSGDSTEVVTTTGSSSQFALNYKIRYACAINDGPEVVITGGYDAIHHCPMKNVSVYSETGFQRYLPSLNERRQYHACARYTDQNGKNCFLVTGGFTGFQNTKSTEVFKTGATAWTFVGDINRARNGMRATTLNNMIYLLGGDTQILRFNNNNSTWSNFAGMTEKAGIKLEISTIKCRQVHNYWPTTSDLITEKYQETTTSQSPTTTKATTKEIPTTTPTTTTKRPTTTEKPTTTTTTERPATTLSISAKDYLRSCVSDTLSNLNSMLAKLDRVSDQDAIMKLTFIKFILGSELFRKERKLSAESCETDLMTWKTMKSQFEDSLTILDSIHSANPIVIAFVADLNSFFTSKIDLINGEINSLNNCSSTPELPSTTTAPTTTYILSEETTTPRPPTKCLAGWSLFQGNCYRYVHERMKWQDAQAFCKAQQADLASIHSEEENEFVAELSHNNWFWLGGRRPYKGCTYFVWSDETEWSYDHWLPAQPDNNRGNEDCVLVLGRNHNWNDAPCHLTRYVVCKQKCVV